MLCEECELSEDCPCFWAVQSEECIRARKKEKINYGHQ